MKRRILTLVLLLVAAAFAAEANPVDLRTAREVAVKFMNANSEVPLRGTDDLRLVKTYNISRGDAAFYVFNTPNGFVIVSADDSATPILGYSNEGQFDVENIPIQLQDYLQDFVEQIQYAIENHLKADERTAHQWELVRTIGWLTNDRTDETVEPLITAMWDQGCYYNAMCPEDENGPCGRCVTGCVATAMAQIMRYWSYPEHGTGSLSYTPNNYPEQSVDFGATTYDWDNMPNSLEASSSPEQIDAVATLMWHCGVSVHMGYGPDESGAFLYSNTLMDYFNYSDELSIDYRNNYSDASWKAKLKDCLGLGRPLLYCGSSGWSAHAFVCDGYDNNDMFHFNWGWSGSYDGYFAIGALVYGFNSNQEACFNLHPQGETTNYVINVSSSNDEGGIASGGGTFAHGTEVALTATPNNGYYFCYWEENGGIASTNPNYSFSANYNRDLVAVFAEPFLITVSTTEGGVVSGGGSYAYGASCTVVATPDEGYAFSYWLEDGNVVSCDSEYSFTVTSERNLTAQFVMSDGIISFDDANVKAVCLANWDTNGDGGLSYAEAAAVTSLGQVFRGNTTITSFDELQYFTGLTSIDDYAFYNCRNLIGLLSVIPSSVTRIGNYAFYGCIGFTGSLNVPISVTEIGYSAFQGCSGFTGELTIHGSVTSIGSAAFRNCYNFEAIMVETANSFYDSRENCNALINTLTDELVLGCKNTVIPNSVISIGSYAFSNCRRLTGSLVIPDSVVSIDSYAFYNCSGLTGSLVIPSSVSEIGVSAFQGCSGFTGSLTIPDSVIAINDYAFYGCSGFAGNLTIGNSVTSIGSHAFFDCGGFSGSLTIPDSVMGIDDSAFYNCSGFSGSLNIPWSVTVIGASAFRGCSGLSGSLTIGVFAMDIDNYAFYGCSGLTSIVFLSYDRPYLGQHVFDNIPTDVPVFVPCGLLEDFQNDWDYPLDLMEMCYDGTITVEASPSLGGMVAGDGIYEDGYLCTVSAMPNEGYCFALWMENDRVVSTDADYSFIVTGDRFLTAVFVMDGNIAFADDNVKSICVTQWDANGDGELSYAEAAAVTSLGQFFKSNTAIASFEELQYFIGVASIGNSAFYGCSNLTGSLIIPSFVTSIGNSAFSGCSGFTGSLTIPNSVTSIGNSAFYGCSGFTGSLNIPNSVTTIGSSAFRDCVGFTGSLTIGNSVTSIGYSAFQGCSGFAGNLTIGNSVTTIVNSAFQGCSGFTGSLTIPNSVTTISDYAFYDCSGFTGNLTIGNSVTRIGDYAFQNCSGFTGNLTIGNSVISIGNSAFQNCNSFTGSLTIPNSVATIYAYAFFGCSGFTGNLTIGNSVTEIGYCAFRNCSGFTGDLNIPDSVIAIYDNTFSGCSGFTGNLTIGNSVTEIGLRAFEGCNGFTGSLTIGNSVTTIWERAFRDCNGFTGNLVIPNSVTGIGTRAFENCSGFTGNLNIGSSVAEIGDYAFQNCSGFTGSLSISNSVNTIGDQAFFRCNGFEAITVETGNSFYDSRGNCNALIKTIANELILGCKNTTIPNSVISIGSNAFRDCSGCTGNLTIPNSVTTIGSQAFENCSGFTGLTLGNSVTTIGQFAFYNCSGFTGSLTIPNSVTTIGNFAFENCSGFTGNLVIPNSVTTIGSSAFENCSGFTGNLVIPNSVSTIGSSAFKGCSGFTGSLTIPNSVVSIGSNAFYNCSGFSGDLYIPNSVTTIGYYAFQNCNGFTGRLTIGNSVTTIYWYAFDNCSSFTSMTVFPEIPPTAVNAFCSDLYGIPVHVPCGSMAAYQGASGWNSFTNYHEDCMQPQTITLTAGTNWFSTYLDISLDDLKAALVAAADSNATITIKNATQSVVYSRDHWNGTLDWDVAKRYNIKVASACEITLEGMPIDPSEHPVTVVGGGMATWIGFPLGESMTLTNAFAGFAQNGDVVKSQYGNATYTRGHWNGEFSLEPGKGYLYISAEDATDRTLTFPTGAK